MAALSAPIWRAAGRLARLTRQSLPSSISTTPATFSTTSPTTSTSTPTERYLDLVAEQGLQRDERQLNVLTHLERLSRDLARQPRPSLDAFDSLVKSNVAAVQQLRAEAAAAQARRDAEELEAVVKGSPAATRSPPHPPPSSPTTTSTSTSTPQPTTTALPPAPRGLYIHGEVGVGKTMLMDLFYETAPVPSTEKRRLHFHSLMRDVMSQLHASHQLDDATRLTYDYNLFYILSRAIAGQARLLCLDELQVPDVATAAILYRLFSHLSDYGVVVVATSNRAPTDLYRGHFRETLFEPFLAHLAATTDVVSLDSDTDYRLQLLDDENNMPTHPPGDVFCQSYFQPLGPAADAHIDACWQAVTQGRPVASAEVTVFGRRVPIPVCTADGVARFHFSDLCAAPLGPSDYLKIAERFHTVFVDDIPILTLGRRNEARRLISLIDALYECKVKLFCTAMRRPSKLFNDAHDVELDHFDIMHREALGEMYTEMKYEEKLSDSPLFSGAEEFFAATRAVSRLYEMRSPRYRQLPHQPEMATAGLDASYVARVKADNMAAASRDGRRATPAQLSKDDRPRFTSDKHFFGGGWWEKIRERLR